MHFKDVSVCRCQSLSALQLPTNSGTCNISVQFTAHFVRFVRLFAMFAMLQCLRTMHRTFYVLHCAMHRVLGGGTKGRKADTGMEHQIGSTRWHRIVVVDYYYCSYCSWLVHQIVSTVAPYCSSLQFTITIATYCSTPDRWHRTVVRCSWLLLLLLVQLTIVTLTITPDSRSNGTVLLFVAVDYFYCYHYLYCSWLLLMLLLPIAVDFCPLQCIHWTGMKLQIVAVVGPHCAKCNLCTVCNMCNLCTVQPVQPVHWMLITPNIVGPHCAPVQPVHTMPSGQCNQCTGRNIW